MDIFDLAELEICPWALREGVILERLDQSGLADGPDGIDDGPGRSLDGVGLPRVQRPRVRLRQVRSGTTRSR